MISCFLFYNIKINYYLPPEPTYCIMFVWWKHSITSKYENKSAISQRVEQFVFALYQEGVITKLHYTFLCQVF